MRRHDVLRSLLLSLIVTSLGFSCGDNDEIVNDLSNNQAYKVNNNGHGYVDLGLSVLWATCNVGANAPSDQGNKYAFGETQVKSSYTSSNYTGGEADVAKELWGGDWRLPTKSELEDIVTRCSWADNTRNNIHVVTATGPNGSSIDLPYYSYLGDEGYQGWYWSSTPASNSRAYCLHFENSVGSGTNMRYYGFLVRPVMPNPNFEGYSDNNGNNDSDGNGSNNTGGSQTYEKPEIGFYDYTSTSSTLKVKYQIYNKDAAKVTSAKIYYGTSVNPTKSKTATISGVYITVTITGLKPDTHYYVKCSATGKGGSTTTSVTQCWTDF